MKNRVLATVLLVAALAAAAPSTTAAPSVRVEDAVRLLSRFPAGEVPVDATVMEAIHTLGRTGDHTEVSLLRSLVEHERDEIGSAAREAISTLRDRQRTTQRASFAASLPAADDLKPTAPPVEGAGLGPEGGRCVAYARTVLGPPRGGFVAPPGDASDPETLLADGMPRKALAAVADTPGPDAGMLRARALEELGDVPGAIRVYAALAVDGHAEAQAALASYHVDAERLLLGLWMDEDPELVPDERMLDTLVRHGGDLTVKVLVERGRGGPPSEQAQAADALARMLDEGYRAVPLDDDDRRAARSGLRAVTANAVAPVRAIAEEALQE